MATKSTPSRRRVTVTLIILFGLIGISIVGLLLPTSSRLWIWLGILVMLALSILVLGWGITDNWFGVLIDYRAKMSLSRFQTVLWSVLILSALLVAAITNIPLVRNPTDALTITIPPELLAVLGISLTALVGQSVILNVAKPAAQVDTKVAKPAAQGVKNGGSTDTNSPDRPSWFDMFKGDDKANAGYVDLSKVQMFYFTLILVVVYGVALASMFMEVDPKHPAISAFPALTPAMVGLLGLSQGGYLVYKALPHGASSGTGSSIPTASNGNADALVQSTPTLQNK